MTHRELAIEVERIPGAMAAFHAAVAPASLRALCETARAQEGRLVALWGSDETTRGGGYALHLALALPSGLAWITAALPRERPAYPGVADVFPAAGRMQRAAFDLLGLVAEGEADTRKWLRHGAWPQDAHPLRKGFDAAKRFAPEPDRYPFVRVEGEGVHEI